MQMAGRAGPSKRLVECCWDLMALMQGVCWRNRREPGLVALRGSVAEDRQVVVDEKERWMRCPNARWGSLGRNWSRRQSCDRKIKGFQEVESGNRHGVIWWGRRRTCGCGGGEERMLREISKGRSIGLWGASRNRGRRWRWLQMIKPGAQIMEESFHVVTGTITSFHGIYGAFLSDILLFYHILSSLHVYLSLGELYNSSCLFNSMKLGLLHIFEPMC